MQMPIIPKAETILFSSGNIFNWNRLKKKPSQAPEAEVQQCFKEVFNEWLDSQNTDDLQFATDLLVADSKRENLSKDDPNTLKITLKLFLHHSQPSQVMDVFKTVVGELAVVRVDTILLSIAECGDDSLCMELVRAWWLALQPLVGAGLVESIGVSDFTTEQLEQLHSASWATVKPSVNQVNLSSCCVIPPEMVEFAREHDIQLLTHNDPPSCSELLSDAQLGRIIGERLTVSDAADWHICWLCRFSVIVKCRGIVKSKGYIMSASRPRDPRRLVLGETVTN